MQLCADAAVRVHRCDIQYDPAKEESTMLQCVVCEDWFHDTCIGIVSILHILINSGEVPSVIHLTIKRASFMNRRRIMMISTISSAGHVRGHTHFSGDMLGIRCS